MFRLKLALPSFEKRIRWILSGYTISLIGTGMTEPYLFLYLYQLRDIPLNLSGMIIGASGMAGVLSIPISGFMADFVGKKQVFLSALILDAAGRILFAFTFNEEIAFLAAFLSGAGAAGAWNALSVILADSAGQAQKASIFGVAFALQNLGSGLGAATSGIVVNKLSVFSFQFIFLLDAATFILFALFGQKWILNDHQNGLNRHRKKHRSPFSSYQFGANGKVLSVLSFCYLTIALVMTGITSTVFPQWSTAQAHVPANTIGDAFGINSMVIVLGQLFILRLVKHVRRTRVIGIATLIFATAYLMIFISGFLKPTPASIGFFFSFAITAVGETLLFSSLPALVNDLASENLRGRYNSMINASWQLGSILGPILAGLALSLHLAALLFLVFISALILLVPFLIVLEHWIPNNSVNLGH
ncbi:MFS transporter [Sporolactobacillus shoreae]|uniref:MFS transporter n=1 Tax=Sporolactobacillus shoreae TaxID=1465501 RepID=A0A4Z0GMV4_9BACL|nr:MFS transporter [Sporolactobacillus shoreae]TGA97637.1 MFS transporter [Sporolactobacillus shoreae]